MPAKKFTRFQLRVTDIHKSDDTLQAAASTTERTIPMVLPEAKIDDDDDDDLYDDLGCYRNTATLIDNDSGDLHSPMTDEDRLVVATQNWLMLKMLLENQAQWKTEQTLERERMAAEWEGMAAERDHYAAERAERTGPSTVGPRSNIHKMVYPIRFCGGAKSCTDFRTRYARISTPTATYYHPVDPITSNTRSLL